MDNTVPLVSMLCVTLTAIVALGMREDKQLAGKAIDTIKDVVKSFLVRK